MKRTLKLLFIVTILLTACSKKHNPTPLNNKGSVNINGVTYGTIVIGTQTWTSQNYDGLGGVVYNNQPDTGNNGKLYTTAEATAITLPAGWRLPSEADFHKLLAAAGWPNVTEAQGVPVLNLMSRTGWLYAKATDSTEFNALPAGYYGYFNTGTPGYQEAGIEAMFITSSIDNGYVQNFTISQFVPYNLALITSFTNPPIESASVRFVKDN